MTALESEKSSSKGIARTMSTVVLAGDIKPVVRVELGDSNSVVVMLSLMNGSMVQDAFPFSMDGPGYTLFSSKVPKNARIAFEATSMAYPFSRKIRQMGYADITAAHATELAWIAKSKKKNDKADALEDS
jgi:hypothetical protein